ncbi:histidine kinase [Actinomyces sp. ZJ308]|uniref:sensor histidine kinase n=1 Tax=Actinomyces sp. ZJ308 TaxID=2708342 RepID=UPI001422D535|nr:histidine kinase [Actinomyces sp. ZJ308]
MSSQLPTPQPGRTATDVPADDDPELQPEPARPGLLRAIGQWYHGHPIIADTFIALGIILLSLLMMFLNVTGPDATPNTTLHLPMTLSVLGIAGAALTLRRRHPVWVWALLLVLPEVYLVAQIYIFHLDEQQRADMAFGIALIPALAMPICLGTIASHRKASVAWTAWAVNLIISTCDSFLLNSSYSMAQFGRSVFITSLVTAIGTLMGLNTRSARLRLKALETRSARMALAGEQAALLAAAEERSRIAREMHDVVAHSLAVMITMADGAAATVERNPATAKQAMETLAEAGRSALADTRRLVGVLREDPSVAGGSTSSASSSGSGRAAASPDRVPPAPPTTPTTGTASEEPTPSGRPAAAHRSRWNLGRKTASPELSASSTAAAPSARSHEVRDVPVPEFAPLGTVAPVEPSAPIASLRRQATDSGGDRSRGDLPLAPAPEQADITELVKRFEAAGVPVSYRWVGAALPADKALQLTVFRIAQEALTNVLRYAPTTPAVSVDVERHIGTVVLTVDNETAPGTRPMHGSGKGLIGMRERASVYGGTVQAGPTPTGWRVRAVLRWDEHDEGTSSWQTPL